jgi:16S rRNA (uracil1498-N3)-methyltransferase
MHRFYLPPEQTQGAVLTLAGQEAAHAIKVLRLQPGDAAVVFNGAGDCIDCRVQETSRQEAVLKVVSRQHVTPLPYQITLLQGIPKGKIMEAIIQKATELGVSRLVPLFSERTTVHLEGDSLEAKTEKWRTVAREAIKQCGAPWLPAIETPATISGFLARGERFDFPLVASLQSGSRPLREYFRTLSDAQRHGLRSLGVWVGPEGDFTPAEMQNIQQSGARPITLGRLVLRCETAALYCLSVLNHEMQAVD